jgi:integrase
VSTDITRGDWRPPEPSRETFGNYAKRVLKLGVGRNGKPLSPTTAELYDVLWRLWLEPTFGDVALGDLTPEKWRTWHATASAEHPGSTQPAKAYRLARAILATAVEDDKIPVNPCKVKGAGREQAPERPIATPDEVLKIAEAIEPQYRAMVLLAAFCSLRFGELAGLRRSGVDLLHRSVRVVEQAVELAGGKVVFKEPKSSSGRTVAIPAEVVKVLEAHLAEHVGPEPTALVFTSPEGHPLRRTKFRPRWTHACTKAGVSDLHFHDLRGSGATWAAHTGATVAELMLRLGHRTPTVAMRYQHATAERDQAIADKLDALMLAAEDSANRQPTDIQSEPRVPRRRAASRFSSSAVGVSS